MNEYEKDLMKAPSVIRDHCVICGRPATELHHAVYRSNGGEDGPVLSLCGWGNVSGCHGLVHSNRLHFRYRDGWEYLITDVPVKVDTAHALEGWRSI